MSESMTENIFRNFYNSDRFIEKADIPKKYGFLSKRKTGEVGYPDFFKECGDYVIVVEAKSDDFDLACKEVQFYIENNQQPDIDMFGIAISGQNEYDYKASLSIKISGEPYKVLIPNGKLQSLDDIRQTYIREKYPDFIDDSELIKILKQINNIFHNDMKIKDTQRSLFFSGIMIALSDKTFRNSYKNTCEPSNDELKTKKWFKCHKLNEIIVNTINDQISTKINNLSKEYNWKDCFSFIKNTDYDLDNYKAVIKLIEDKIFVPYSFNQKTDILGKAYKIFLSKAGKIDNKNIILTPDHIKQLMVELAQLEVDDVFIDTCTGSGGFLMEAMEVMTRLASNDNNKIADIKEKQLIGFEIDPTLFALACTNMFLHQDGRSNLIYHDSLVSESTYSDIYNEIKHLTPHKCVINPPYENNQPIKFLETALKLIEKNGKVIIIMPTPTLVKNKKKALELLEYATLDFVIKMPNNLFVEQGRSVNTSIFGFTKKKHRPEEDVIFYNMDDDGLVSVQHKGRIDKHNKWREIIHPSVRKVLCGNSRTTDDKTKMRPLFKDGEVNFYGHKPNNGNTNYVKFGELFDFGKNGNGIRGTLQSENSVDGEYDFITASEEWKTNDTYQYEKDDSCLVYAVSAGGSLGRCHYVKGEKPYIVSNLCLVLKPLNDKKYPINMLFYSIYLNKIRKEIVNEIADGTSKLTLNPKDLKEYLIEYFDIDYQNKVARDYENKVLKLKESLLKNMEIFESSLHF